MNCYTKDLSGHIGKFICVSVVIGVIMGMFHGASEEYERSKNKGSQKLVDMSFGVYLGGILGLITGPTSIITGCVLIWKKVYYMVENRISSLPKAASITDQQAKIQVLESQVISLQQSLAQSQSLTKNEVSVNPVYSGIYPGSYPGNY